MRSGVEKRQILALVQILKSIFLFVSTILTMIILACTSVIHINFSHNIINYVTYVIAYIYHIIISNSQSQINLARVALKQRCSSLHRRHHDQFSWSGILVSYQHSCLKLFWLFSLGLFIYMLLFLACVLFFKFIT